MDQNESPSLEPKVIMNELRSFRSEDGCGNGPNSGTSSTNTFTDIDSLSWSIFPSTKIRAQFRIDKFVNTEIRLLSGSIHSIIYRSIHDFIFIQWCWIPHKDGGYNFIRLWHWRFNYTPSQKTFTFFINGQLLFWGEFAFTRNGPWQTMAPK